MFFAARSFNAKISDWDVSQVRPVLESLSRLSDKQHAAGLAPATARRAQCDWCPSPGCPLPAPWRVYFGAWRAHLI